MTKMDTIHKIEANIKILKYLDSNQMKMIQNASSFK